mmetsp:Transcript_54162/g.136290  ORF Transcript_54162/g.136290 Transcript_54162/m.136290 type:complete len:86 (+) Transcript_54162:271-528(+)
MHSHTACSSGRCARQARHRICSVAAHRQGAEHVMATDGDRDVLELASTNLAMNRKLSGGTDDVAVYRQPAGRMGSDIHWLGSMLI